MYDLMKKNSKQKQQQKERTSRQQQHVPTQLVNLLEQAMRRQDEYIKIIQSLKQQKEHQAKEYTKKLDQFSTYLQEFKKKKQEEEGRKQFRSFEMVRQQEAMRRPKRTMGKKQYTIQDIPKFSLEIELKFLFFNPIMQDPLSSHYPKKLQIKFNSLGLEFMSGKISYSQQQNQHRQLLNDRYPFILQSTATKHVCFTLSLTPSKNHNINNIAQLIRQIKSQLLEIEVLDYDSQILFGVSHISLQQLLFYDKTEDYWVEEALIFSPLRSRDVGKIDIQFRNYKAPVSDISNNDLTGIQPYNTKQAETQGASKLKVTSNNPISAQTPQYDIRSVEQKQRRLLRRINQHKQENIKLGKSIYMNFDFDYMTNEVNKRKLDHILKVKQENKYNFSEEILSKLHQQFQSYECAIGNVLIIPFVFCNNFDERMIFNLVPSETMKQMKHITLVTNQSDYQFYKRDQKIAGQAVQFTNRQSLTFSLAAAQTVFILVKYLTFVHVPERSFQIYVNNAHNSESVQTYVFKVRSVAETVDHRFRVFEGEGKTTQLFVPNGDVREQQMEPYLYCKESQLEYTWANDGFSIRIPIFKNQSIIVYLYESSQCRKLLKCYEIVIKKFIIVQFNNYELGLQKTVQLQIPSSQQSNQVRFFSSDTQKLWTQHSKSLKIKSNSIQTVTVTGRNLYFSDENIILSCNKLSGEVYCQWLFKFKTSKPVFKNIYEILASTNRKIGYTLEIQNPSNRSEAFGIVSNNLPYVNVEESKKVANGSKMIFVALVIHPHEEGEKEVIVNVSNFDQSVNMNYLLRLRFTRQYKEQEKSVEEIVHRRY